MHAWEAIQLTINHIEDHIFDDIKIEDLSIMAGLSQFYYQRLFARLVKSPVNEYIKLRRLAKASEELLQTSKRIIDVAYEYGFNRHETFTRMFKKVYGITPEKYRKQAIVLDHFDKPDLMLNYVMVDEGVPLIAEDFVIEYNRKTIEQAIRFVGVKGYYHFMQGKMLGERPGISEPEIIWQNFFKVKHKISVVAKPKLVAVSYQGDAKVGYSSYFVGLESHQEIKDDGLSSWILPARTYLICGFEAETFQELTTIILGKAMKHIRFWLREHGLTADGFFPEIHLPNVKETAYMEMWIPFKKRENK